MTARTTPFFATILVCCVGSLSAQTPKDPPPWWGIADEDTVSLYWDFNSQSQPLQPTIQILPSWYSPLPTSGNNFGFTNSSNITWIASLGNQPGVMGFTGAGTGTISALIENDFRTDWIKIFTMQFDAFAAGASTITAKVAKDLVKYERGIIEEKTEPLTNGWVRTTLSMYLIPQPYSEDLDIVLNEAATSSVAIDNLFVNSRCVKPPPDEKGTAYGDVDASYSMNLTSATGGSSVGAVAATEDNGNPPVMTLWVAGTSGGNNDQVQRLSRNGAQLGGPILLPAPTPTTGGVADITVARVPVTTPVPGVRTFVYSLLDRRASGGVIDLVGIDADLPTPVVVAGLQVTVPAPLFSGPGPLSLAFSPHGDLGRGSFWIADRAGNVAEVARVGGALLRTLTAAQNNIPLGISGVGYDTPTGHLYWFVNAPVPTASGPTQIMVFEHDGFTLQPTGVRCLADDTLANPGGNPGGVARGLEVLRRRNGDFRLLCVQQVGAVSFLRALGGPPRFGWSLLGRITMRGIFEMGGNPFQLGLTGVPHATSALCFIGFSNQQNAGQNLPLPLAPLGFDESRLSISLDMSFAGTQQPDGSFLLQGLTPPLGAFAHRTPVFFQWLVAEPNFPPGLAASQAGEALLY